MRNDPKKWVAIQDELLVFFPTTITIRVRPLSDLFIRVYNGVTTYNYTYARLLAKYNKIT